MPIRIAFGACVELGQEKSATGLASSKSDAEAKCFSPFVASNAWSGRNWFDCSVNSMDRNLKSKSDLPASNGQGTAAVG